MVASMQSSTTFGVQTFNYMGDCQNSGPFLGSHFWVPIKIRGRVRGLI